MPFSTPGTIKGLAGKRVLALGYGNVTLTDIDGHKCTILNVLYVPDSSTNILSLVKLKKSGLLFRFLNDSESPGSDGEFFTLDEQNSIQNHWETDR